MQEGGVFDLGLGWLFLIVAVALLFASRVTHKIFSKDDKASDTKQYLGLLGADLCRDVALAFFPLAIIALLYEHKLKDDLLSAMKTEMYHESAKAFKDAGITKVYYKLDHGMIRSNLMKARKQVRVLTTHFPDLTSFTKDIEEVFFQGCAIDIYLLDPNSSVLRDRSAALNRDPEYGKRKVLDDIEELKKMATKLTSATKDSLANPTRGQLRVWTYNSLPSMFVLQFDDVSYVSFYVHGNYAPLSTQLEISGKGTWFAAEIENEFEWIAKASELVLDSTVRDKG